MNNRATDLLQEGDIIEIRSGDRVYTEAPAHFFYMNKKGCWDLSNGEAVVGGELWGYLEGKYVVTHTAFGGGGGNDNDRFPDGHRVYCEKLVESYESAPKLNFYQTGCFTCMIPDRAPLGKAEKTWRIQKAGVPA